VGLDLTGFLRKIRLRRNDDLECKQLYKTDVTGVNIAGIDYNNIFKLGKFEVQRLVRDASHMLLVLDLQQFRLCNTIKSMKGKKRQQYLEKMADQQLEARDVYRVIDALSRDPSSTDKLNTLKERYLSSLHEGTDEKILNEKIQDVYTKAMFYDTIIKKLDRMLDNPEFLSMSGPEPLYKIEKTLKEIDLLMDRTLVARNTTIRYRDIRGPWKKLYTGDFDARSKFARGVRDFRNHLA
jgi:wobble nucleotide-excising tRNase